MDVLNLDAQTGSGISLSLKKNQMQIPHFEIRICNSASDADPAFRNTDPQPSKKPRV